MRNIPTIFYTPKNSIIKNLINKNLRLILKHFTVCDFSGTRNPGGGGGGGNGMLDMSELVEVTFLRRSASASRLLLAPARGTPALDNSVVA